VSLVILAVVLSLSLSRLPVNHGWRKNLVTLAVVPVVGISAVSVSQLLQQHFALGATVLTLAIASSFLLRQFSWSIAQAGRLLLLPATAILVVPAVGFTGAGDGRWWVTAVGVTALIWVTAFRHLATWLALVPPNPKVAIVPSPAPFFRSGQTRMALWMAISVAIAFTVGRNYFPLHWNWTVLTAIIVCGGGPSRGEVVVKGVARLIGAGVGTLIATVVAAGLPGHQNETVVIIFAVLFVGTWWRDAHYAVWAACATCVMALLTSYFDSFGGPSVLTTRWLAIVIGAACSVGVCSLIYPIPIERIVRRRRGNALAALQDLAKAMATPGADVRMAGRQLEFRVTELKQSLRPFRWQQKMLGALWPPDAVLMSTTTAVLDCLDPASIALAYAQIRPDDPDLADSALDVARHIGAVRKRLANRTDVDVFTPSVIDGGLAELNQAVLAIP